MHGNGARRSTITFLGGGGNVRPDIEMNLRPIRGGGVGGASRITSGSGVGGFGGCWRIMRGGAGGIE